MKLSIQIGWTTQWLSGLGCHLAKRTEQRHVAQFVKEHVERNHHPRRRDVPAAIVARLLSPEKVLLEKQHRQNVHLSCNTKSRGVFRLFSSNLKKESFYYFFRLAKIRLKAKTWRCCSFHYTKRDNSQDGVSRGQHLAQPAGQHHKENGRASRPSAREHYWTAVQRLFCFRAESVKTPTKKVSQVGANSRVDFDDISLSGLFQLILAALA